MELQAGALQARRTEPPMAARLSWRLRSDCARHELCTEIGDHPVDNLL